jgi:hypothetical protein
MYTPGQERLVAESEKPGYLTMYADCANWCQQIIKDAIFDDLAPKVSNHEKVTLTLTSAFRPSEDEGRQWRRCVLQYALQVQRFHLHSLHPRFRRRVLVSNNV